MAVQATATTSTRTTSRASEVAESSTVICGSFVRHYWGKFFYRVMETGHKRSQNFYCGGSLRDVVKARNGGKRSVAINL